MSQHWLCRTSLPFLYFVALLLGGADNGRGLYRHAKGPGRAAVGGRHPEGAKKPGGAAQQRIGRGEGGLNEITFRRFLAHTRRETGHHLRRRLRRWLH